VTTEVEVLRSKLKTALAVGEATDRELVNHALALRRITGAVKRALHLIDSHHVVTATRVLREALEEKSCDPRSLG